MVITSGAPDVITIARVTYACAARHLSQQRGAQSVLTL